MIYAAYIVLGVCFIALMLICCYLILLNFYHKALLEWCDEREPYFVAVFQATRAIEKHQYQWGRMYEGRFGSGSDYRGLSFKGTELNYESLAAMVMIDQEQRKLLEVAIDHVTLFELEHPIPPAPWLIEKLTRSD